MIVLSTTVVSIWFISRVCCTTYGIFWIQVLCSLLDDGKQIAIIARSYFKCFVLPLLMIANKFVMVCFLQSICKIYAAFMQLFTVVKIQFSNCVKAFLLRLGESIYMSQTFFFLLAIIFFSSVM